VWNDLEADEKIRVYDKGIERSGGNAPYDVRVIYRTGDLWVPRVEQVEALSLEARYFVDCIYQAEVPFNDGMSGLRVVQMIEAINQSMSQRGEMVYCDTVKPTSSKVTA
jgi:predicted dehydrogenase